MYFCLLRATAVSLAMLSMLKSENCVGEVGIHVGNFANLAIFVRMHCRAARFFVFCSADALRTGRVCRLQCALHCREDGGLAHRCRWQAQAVLLVEGGGGRHCLALRRAVAADGVQHGGDPGTQCSGLAAV